MATKKKSASKKTAGKEDAKKSASAGVKAATASGKKKAAPPVRCMGLLAASNLVLSVVPNNPPTNQPLKFIMGANKFEIFQQAVFDKILARGCSIKKGQIPHDGDNTLDEVISAIAEFAVKLA